MRICDRCKSPHIEEVWTGTRSGGQIDLCKNCNEEFVKFMTAKPEEEKSGHKRVARRTRKD